MKTLVVLVSLVVLAVAPAQAASKFAGEYIAYLHTFFPSAPTPKLVGAVNVTVASDGSITGRGVYLDRAPINVTGTVSDSGDIGLNFEGSQFQGVFQDSGKQFFFAFPEMTIIGAKIARKFPEAGIYHAKTSSQEKVLLLVDRDRSVHGTVTGAGHPKIEIEGTATTAGFAAESVAGTIFKGKFDGPVIAGRFTNRTGGSGTLTGAKY